MNDTTAESRTHRHPRVEDDALVRGLGRFVEDTRQGKAHAVFVRSPHACARIRSIDSTRRAARPASSRVLTGADTAGRRQLGASAAGRPRRQGADHAVPPGARARARDACRPAGRAGGRRDGHGGAGRRRAGRGRLRGRCRRSPTCARRSPGRAAALAGGAGQRRARLAGTGRRPEANAREVERSSPAAHVARVAVVNQRLVVATMEPRGATARYDAATDTYTLRACSQGAGPQRDQLLAIMTRRRSACA